MAILAQDTFTEVDGFPLNSHIPDVGNLWQEDPASEPGFAPWRIYGQRLEPTIGGATAWIDCGNADATISVEVVLGDTPGQPSQAALVGRLADADNCWLLYAVVGGDLSLIEMVNGTPTERDTTTVGFAADDIVTLELTLDGDDLTGTATVNGTPYTVSYNSSLYNSETNHGIWSSYDLSATYADTQNSFDNFEVVGSVVYTETPTGGVVVGGSASPTLEIAVGGGVLVNSTAALIDSPGVSGGVVVGSDSLDDLQVYFTPTGGVVINSPAYDNGWVHRVLICVPTGQVAEDLCNFLLVLKTSIDENHVYKGDDDFRFEDLDGNVLDHEIRAWENGCLVAVVKVSLSADNDNCFYLYYGDDRT